LVFYPAIIEFRVWKNDYKYKITLNRRDLEITAAAGDRIGDLVEYYRYGD